MKTMFRLLRILLWDLLKLCLWVVVSLAATAGFVYCAVRVQYVDWVFGAVILLLFLFLVFLMSVDYIGSVQTRLKPKKEQKMKHQPTNTPVV